MILIASLQSSKLSLTMLPQDQFKFLTGIFLSVPFSFAFRFINGYQLRKYYSFILALILEYYVFGKDLGLALILHTFMYYLIENVKREHVGMYATFASMFLVSCYHVYVMIVDYGRWQIDVSTILMMSVCKYSLFAFSYQDGQEQGKLQIKIQQRLNQKIQKLPIFIDFLSYMTFLPTALGNTPFDYSTYEAFLKKEKQFAQIPFKTQIKKFGEQLAGMLVCLTIYIISTIYFPTKVYNDPNYMDQGVFYHVWYSYLATNLLTFKYFFGFKLMQLPVHASGVSYKPSLESKDDFQGIRTIDIISFEKAFHLRDKVASWNISVQQWLRKCIYQRLPYGKSNNQLITFMVSAFWHGYYPGYYVTFGLYFLQIYAGNLIYKFSRNYPKHPIIQLYKKSEDVGYYAIWMVWTWIFVNNSAYFPALSGHTAWVILSSMYFANPIFIIILIIFFSIITPKKKAQKQRNQ